MEKLLMQMRSLIPGLAPPEPEVLRDDAVNLSSIQRDQDTQINPEESKQVSDLRNTQVEVPNKTNEVSGVSDEQSKQVGHTPEGPRISDAPQSFHNEQAPSFMAMSDDNRVHIESESSRLGVDPEDYNMKMWSKITDRLAKATGTGNPAAVSKTIDQAYGVKTNPTHSTHKDVRSVSHLLNLIGKTEGTDKGRGYNETLSYGAYTGGDVELTSMTLGEIKELQRKMLRHPKNKWNSSAIGRYQIVGTTLRGLQKNMGLNDAEKFTPDLQDRMALQLLKGRGLDQWSAGTKSTDSFMNGLSAEWASLPKANGRATYNQGLGANASSVLQTLNMMKGNG